MMGGFRVLGIHHHGMLSAVTRHPMQRAAAMHLLAKLHAERSHCLNRQGQYQEADKSGTQPFAHVRTRARGKMQAPIIHRPPATSKPVHRLRCPLYSP